MATFQLARDLRTDGLPSQFNNKRLALWRKDDSFDRITLFDPESTPSTSAIKLELCRWLFRVKGGLLTCQEQHAVVAVEAGSSVNAARAIAGLPQYVPADAMDLTREASVDLITAVPPIN